MSQKKTKGISFAEMKMVEAAVAYGFRSILASGPVVEVIWENLKAAGGRHYIPPECRGRVHKMVSLDAPSAPENWLLRISIIITEPRHHLFSLEAKGETKDEICRGLTRCLRFQPIRSGDIEAVLTPSQWIPSGADRIIYDQRLIPKTKPPSKPTSREFDKSGKRLLKRPTK